MSADPPLNPPLEPPQAPASATRPGTESGAPLTAAPAAGSQDVLERLADVIDQRRAGDPDKSYVARLFHKGTDAILKKVGEEATETVMAAKDGERSKIVYEVADLWFHTMIALAHFGLRPADVLAELSRREGLSGLEEFAARKAREREAQENAAPAHPPQQTPPSP